MKNLTWRLGLFIVSLSLSCILVLVVILASSAATYSPLVGDVDIANGKSIFRDRCASCHSLDPTAPAIRGPNLGTLTERKPYGTDSLTDYLLESLLEPQAFRSTEQFGYMPNAAKGLVKSEIVSLVGYLIQETGETQSLRELSFKHSSIPAKGVEKTHDFDHPDFETIEQGRKIFLGKGQCATCHDWIAWESHVWEKASSMAPNLRNVGTKPKEHLRESILDPNKVILGGYETTLVLLDDGSTVSGRIVGQDDSSYSLVGLDSGGNYKLSVVEKSSIEDLKTNRVSSMPSYKDTLTEEELEAIIAFISYL